MSARTDAALALLGHLSRAAASRAIYPGSHPAIEAAVTDLRSALDDCLEERGDESITFLVLAPDVILDERPLRTRSLFLRPFVRLMDRLGVQRITLARGLREDEGHRLLAFLSGAEEWTPVDHVVLGRLELGERRRGGGGAATLDVDLDAGQDAFRGLGARRGEIDALDRLVWSVIEELAGSSRSLVLLAPTRQVGESLFQHSLQVGTLALALARSLGIEGAALHEVGLAALLHDIGKTVLPETLWSRDEPLSGRALEVARLHPEIGAAVLCESTGSPPLAILVAYEHHLRWDGKPSYPASERLPNLASQITAVADTWDTLAVNAEPGPEGRSQALAVWQERSGTVLDPFLVGQFLLLLAEAGDDV